MVALRSVGIPIPTCLIHPARAQDGPQYSLTSFHTLAESYKRRWFSGLSEPPTTREIERDFWDIGAPSPNLTKPGGAGGRGGPMHMMG